ncbi:MAG: hypothetical protein U0172_03600 [Nitrospiraceae bacterium]
MSEQVPDRERSTRSTARVLTRVHESEPIFVLRARDPLAAMFVRLWAQAQTLLVQSLDEREPWKSTDIVLQSVLRDAEQRLGQALPPPRGGEPLKATQAMDLAAQMDDWPVKQVAD